MDTIERIEFLATLPNELRPVTCELKTKNRTYEGIIQKCDSKKVFFTFSGEEKTITIPLEHIVSISLIGKS
jgi:ribosome maturation factor RimP